MGDTGPLAWSINAAREQDHISSHALPKSRHMCQCQCASKIQRLLVEFRLCDEHRFTEYIDECIYHGIDVESRAYVVECPDRRRIPIDTEGPVHRNEYFTY
jgi:hypothetical protein